MFAFGNNFNYRKAGWRINFMGPTPKAHDDLVEALAVFQVDFFHFSVSVRLSAWPLS
jgi:hypothetical protein